MPPLDQVTRAPLEQKAGLAFVIHHPGKKAGMRPVSVGAGGRERARGAACKACVPRPLPWDSGATVRTPQTHAATLDTPADPPVAIFSDGARGGGTPAVAGTSHWPMLGLARR